VKITRYLYNAFLVEEGGTRIAIDPGQYFNVPFLWKKIAFAEPVAFSPCKSSIYFKRIPTELVGTVQFRPPPA
jgi:L-ascorbate metabolism protein UlaG (beta-lactamase superfamily)